MFQSIKIQQNQHDREQIFGINNLFFSISNGVVGSGKFTLKITQEETTIYAKTEIAVNFEWYCEVRDDSFAFSRRPYFIFTRKNNIGIL